MLSIDKKILSYNVKEVHFSDNPYDIGDCDFLTFRYCKNKVDAKGFTCKKEFTIVVDLTQDLDKIWRNIDKNARYWINRAQRENIKIHINKDYEQFFQMYRSFIKKKGIKSFFDVFGVGSTSIENMKKYGTLFTAEYNGEILAGTLYLENEFHIKSWIGASKRLESEDGKKKLIAAADRLIDWEVIKYAKEKGIIEFDLGGIWPEEEAEKDTSKKGINKFKSGLGGKTISCYTYQKIYSKTFELAYQVYSLKNLNGNGKQ